MGEDTRAGAGAPQADDGATERFGTTGRGRTLAIYGGLLGAALVVVQLLLMVGRGLHAPKASGDTGQAHEAINTHDVVWKLLLAAAVIIVVSRIVGAAFRRINQPQVVGEIVAGIMLGPSLLGAIWPGATHWLFSPTVLPFIDVLSQVGLIFFMFLIGLELDIRLIKGRGHAAGLVSHVSIIAPFLLGIGLALVLFSQLGSAAGEFTPFALFLGASMSITAFPVLARILTERGIYKTRLGAVTLTCAAVDDVTAWCLLAVVVAVARASGPASALVTIGLSIVFVAFMIGVVRPALARLARYHEEQGQLGGAMLAALFVGILLSALATDRIGIHAIFGAFLFGAIMPQRSELIRELVDKLEDFTVVFLLPLFFAFTGLRTEIGLLGTNPELWLFCGLILVVAVVGKWGGSSLAARIVGLEWRESMALGILMNTRGLTELIILNIGLDLGVIPPTLFAMLVIMALVTTFMTTPILSLIYPNNELEEMVAREAGDEEEDAERRWRLLVSVPSTQLGMELVHTAIQLARDERERAQIILLRVVQLPGSAYRAGPMVQESMVRRATERLRPLVELVEGAGYEAVPLVVPSASVGDAIERAVRDRHPDLTLLAWHRSPWGRQLLGGTVGDVLRRADGDVAVLVDPARRGLVLSRDSRIVVPYGGGFHENVGLDLAARLGEASGATITLLGAGGEDDARGLGEKAASVYESTGVWTEPLPVEGDLLAAVDRQARDADLVVLGVSDKWVEDKHSLGTLRDAVLARAAAPLLVVRRHGQRQRRLRGQREWMDEHDSGQVPAVSVEGQAGVSIRSGR
jgi:Kef-type K+ transport system membrane component KefB/nucleotide-binding universal stress UspA family protein